MIVPRPPIKALARFGVTAKKPLEFAVEEYHYYYDKVFYYLRRNLGLSDMEGSSTLVGLHTLLDGVQIEYRVITRYFMDYVQDIGEDAEDSVDIFDDDHPVYF
ncbi:hypothetical protein H4R35_001523 [Dimargaris xerosporica]|nr:hypothetical protein H4R35_001523 [Dimargaris xerosporica]